MPIIIANWKMNPSDLNEALSIFDFMEREAENNNKAEIVICPPFMYLSAISAKLLEKKENANNIKIGAQNCFWEKDGAYTGEISPIMLRNMSCEYIILGHSERREYLNEDDKMINKKIKAALEAGLKVIFCVGEKKRDESGNYFNFLKKQIESGLYGISAQELENIIVAYEPVWAISANKNARADTAEDLAKMVIFIKKILADIFAGAENKAQEIKIIYGGSVNKENFKDFLYVPEISGLLIGADSLNPEELKNILKNI